MTPESAHAIGHASREVQRDWPIYLLVPLAPVVVVGLALGALIEAGWEAMKGWMRR